MSAGCNQVISSRIKVSIVPNTTCASAPTLHQLKTSIVAVVGESSMSIQLDSTFIPTSGAYTAASRFALVPGSIIDFGGVKVEVADATNGSGVYFISTAAQVVNVVRLTDVVPVDATAETFFAVPLCLKSSNINTSSTQVDNTTNCTGTLFTQITTGYMKTLEMAGFLASNDFGYFTLSSLGKDLKSIFFAIDYDGRFLTVGLAQLTDPSITEAVVKQLAGYTLQGQIQSLEASLGSYLTVADQAALAKYRAHYGFRASQGINTLLV